MKSKIYCLLLFTFFYTAVMAQNKTVTGTVISGDGEPLSGVTVNLKGTKGNQCLRTLFYKSSLHRKRDIGI